MRSRRRSTTTGAASVHQHVSYSMNEASSSTHQQSHGPITSQPQALTQPHILGLQRQLGNQHVTRLLRRTRPIAAPAQATQALTQADQVVPSAVHASSPAPSSAGATSIQRIATDNVEDRVTHMRGWLVKQAGFSTLPDLMSGQIKTWYEQAIRDIFATVTPGHKDKDALYASVIPAIKELLAAFNKYTDMGADFGRTDLKDAKKNLLTALQGRNDAEAIEKLAKGLTKLIDDKISDSTYGNQILGRMKMAHGKEQEYEKYATLKDFTKREQNEIEKFKAAIEAAKSKDTGVTENELKPFKPIQEELAKLAAITTIADQLKATYMAAPFHLPEAEANVVYKKRHGGNGYKTEGAMRTEYKQAVRDWRATPAGNATTTVVPDETYEPHADFGPNLEEHLFEGSISMSKGSGVHFRSALEGPDPTARVVAGTRQEEGSGFWSAKVEVKQGTEWKAKDERSTFFPDGWTRDIILEQITQAWNAKVWVIDDKKWQGTANGVVYVGYVNTAGEITAAWPQVIPQPTDLN